jgi:iron complex outermembrane receptor protein
LWKFSHTQIPGEGLQGWSRKVLVGSLFLSSLLVSTAKVAVAQVASRELLLFMEVPTVVTAARREQPLTKASATTKVITTEDIRRSGAHSIPEILRYVAGLDVSRASVSDVNVTARGLNTRVANRMQVFIDGRSVYEDFLNIVLWEQSPFSMQEIERIEIVESPASALFGANAFSGAINIITKSPDALKGTHVSGTVGDEDTGIASLIHAGVTDKFGYKVSFGYDRTNNFPNPGRGKTGDEKGLEDFRGNVLAEYTFSEGSQASLSGGIDNFERDIDTGLGLLLADGNNAFTKFNYSLDDLKAQLVWNHLDSDLEFTEFPSKGSVLANTIQADVQNSFTLAANNILTGGISYHFNAFNSQLLIRGDEDQHIFAFFLQDEWSPLDALTFTLGLRVDTHPETGVHVSPRGVVVYSPWENHTFRASVSTAFRNPSIVENFFDLQLPTVKIMGNPDLDAEQIISFELGYQAFLFERLKTRIDLFYNHVDELIEIIPPAGPVTTFANVDAGPIYGGEFSLEFFLVEWLQGFLNYSYQDRDFDNPIALGVVPRHKGNFGLNFTLPHGFSADVFVNAVGESEGAPGKVDPYTLVNIRLGYQFEVLGADAEVDFAVFNLFNDVHQEIPGGDFIDRRITGSIHLSF